MQIPLNSRRPRPGLDNISSSFLPALKIQQGRIGVGYSPLGRKTGQGLPRRIGVSYRTIRGPKSISIAAVVVIVHMAKLDTAAFCVRASQAYFPHTDMPLSSVVLFQFLF